MALGTDIGSAIGAGFGGPPRPASDRIGYTPPGTSIGMQVGQPANYTSDLSRGLAWNNANYDNQRGYMNGLNDLDMQRNALTGQSYGMQQGDVNSQRARVGLQQQGIGLDYDRLNQSDNTLNQQGGLYGQLGDNSIASIMNQITGMENQRKGLGYDMTNTHNQYINDMWQNANKAAAGGAFNAPANSFNGAMMSRNKDTQLGKIMNQAAGIDINEKGAGLDIDRAKLNTQMQMLGVNDQLAGNKISRKELGLKSQGLNYDLADLDRKMASVGINMQLNGLDKKKLELDLNNKLGQLGLQQYMDAQTLLNKAASGTGQEAAAAQQTLQQLLQSGQPIL